MRQILAWAVMALMFAAGPVATQQPAPLGSCAAPAGNVPDIERRSSYIPMEDGVRLAIDVFLPKGLAAGTRLPTILVSTRYWRGAEGQPVGPMEKFWLSHGYAYAYADVRGTGASYGQWFYPWAPREVKDIGGIVAWVAAQPWSDGQVGSIGTSYTGNTAQLVGASGNPAVKAVVPRFMDFDVYADLTYPGGVVNEMLIRDWGKMVYAMDMNKVDGAPNGVRRVGGDTDGRLIAAAVKDHQGNPPLFSSMDGINYRDDVVPAFGGASNDMSGTYRLRTEIERAAVPIFGWASWLDAGTSQGLVNRFMNWSNPQIVVVGPWSHGGGNHTSPFRPAATPTEPTSLVQNEQAACFFDQYLRGKANGFGGKLMIYYTLGEEKWKSTAVWPVKGTRMTRYYFGAGNKLSSNRPGGEGSDDYRVDFDVSTGTNNRWYTQLSGQDVVYEERSGQDGRMLTYTSEPLAKDLEVTGQGIVTLSLATTATDGNFIVYLEDVSPEGKSTYVAEGLFRGLHRKISTEAPPYRTLYPYHSFKKQDGAPMVPGQRTTLTFQLIPTSVLFKTGHRIRVAVAGADKDTFQRVPSKGDVKLTVDRSASAGSFIELPVVPRG